MKSFKKQKYVVIRNAIKKDLANFAYHYLNKKRNVCYYLQSKRLISPFDDTWGDFNDGQIPNTYSCYSDLVMETLLVGLKNKIEKATKYKLVETYSYTRIYKKGDELVRHKDRKSCDISATLCLGGDKIWPIFLEPSGKENEKGVAIKLKPGDLMCYAGCFVEHWREPFDGNDCGQVFLHYNNKKDKKAIQYDGRPFIGLPAYTRNFK